MKVFEESMNHKLNQCFPQKTTKLGVGEEPFITSELKNLKRRRMREYRKNFKSAKYLRLKEEFEEKYKNCAQKHLRKNVDSLKETNPGQSYNIMKKLGAKPGEWDQSNSFTLPSHENLSV